MKAAVWHGRGDVRVEEVPDPPDPGPGDALVEVARCGLCGSDRREFDEGPVLIRRSPHPLTGFAPPVVLGHEIAGTVVAVGDDWAQDLVGRRVAVDPTRSCGRCEVCRRGDAHLCQVASCLGISSHGGLAPMVLAPAAGLVRVGDAVSDDAAALAEPLAVALHAVDRGGMRLGDRVVISGFGPIGASVLIAVQAAGASQVVVVEPHSTRRSAAAALGAHAIDAGSTDDARALRGFADVGFECSGAAPALDATLRLTRAGGRVVVAAVSHGAIELPSRAVVLGERTVSGTVGYRGDIARAVRLMEHGLLDVAPLVATVQPLSAVPRWLADPSAASEGLKALVDPRVPGVPTHA